MHKIGHNLTLKQIRKKRNSGKLRGVATKPRISVFRSNKHLLIQAVDDEAKKTLAAASDLKVNETAEKTTKTQKAQLAAVALAEILKSKQIKAAIFDRGAYRYHGRVKAVAESLRESGIKI